MATNFTPLVTLIGIGALAVAGTYAYKQIANTANPVTQITEALEPYTGAINTLAPGVSNALTGAGGALSGAGGLLNQSGQGVGNLLTSTGTGVTDLTSAVGSLVSSPATLGKMLYTGIGNFLSGNTSWQKANQASRAKAEEYGQAQRAAYRASVNKCWEDNRNKWNYFQLVFKCGLA